MAAKKTSSHPTENLDYLTDQYRQTVSRAWSSIPAGEARIPLTQVFVLLEAVKRPPPRPLEQRPDLPDLPDRMKRAGLESPKEAAPEPVPMALSQVLQQERHLALLGEPGSGKSTTLQFIGLCLATDGWAEEKLGLADAGVPIRLDLKEWAGDLARPGGSLLDALTLSVKRVMELSDSSEASKLVLHWRDSDRLVILLDGLDEVPDQLRSAVQSEIERLSFRGVEEKVRLVVTSRPAGYATLPESIKEFTLKPFAGRQEALPYLEKWLAVLQPDWDAQGASARLLDEMNAQPALRRLTDNPLLLRLSAEIYARSESIASSRADLYNQYIHQEAWPRAIQRGADPALKNSALKELEQIAWKMQSGKTLAHVEYEILLREQMGLLVRASDQFAFGHTTFQEYFVAQYLTRSWMEQRETTWNFLRPRLHLPNWREPLLLMVGTQEEHEAEELVLRVLRAGSRYEKYLHRDLLLAAGLLIEQKNQAIRASQVFLKSALKYFRWTFRNNGLHLQKASEALVQIGSPDAVPALIERLKHEDAEVRYSAADVLGRIGSPDAVPILIVQLKDEDADVRASVAEALVQIGSPDAVPALIERLKDEDADVRASAAEALGQIGAPDAVPVLIVRLKDEDANVRASATAALRQIGAPDAVPALIERLKHEDAEVRASAAEALGRIGAPDAVPALIERLKDEDADVRASAAQALGQSDLGAMPLTEQLATLRQAARHQVYEISNRTVWSSEDDGINFAPLLIRLETLEASQLGTEIDAERVPSKLRRALRAGLIVIGVFLVAGLVGLLMILARIFDEIVKGQWVSGLQTVFATRPFLAPALVVLLAGLIALLTWSLVKLKERK